MILDTLYIKNLNHTLKSHKVVKNSDPNGNTHQLFSVCYPKTGMTAGKAQVEMW